MNERHHLTFDTYEEGKLSLDEYLKRVVFYQSRQFSPQSFKQFMYDQSKSFPEMIDLIQKLKSHYKLNIFAISDEGRELTNYRVRQFKLDTLIESFISSCFVHYRKPDHDIYRIALDIAQVRPEQAVYIDDRALFIEVATSLGINGILHRDFETTRTSLAEFGLDEPE